MEEIERVKEVSIKDYLEQTCGCQFRRVGSRWFCLSPLRGERNPSFCVNAEESLWYDFGTGEGGDIISLVQKLHGLGFKDAVQHLLNYTGYVRPVPKLPERGEPPKIVDIERLYRNLLRHSRRSEVERYFNELGVRYPREAGPVEYRTLREDFIAFPCPSPERILGLELRGIGVKKRLTLGKKTPWVLYRGSQGLASESILDSLAGEVLYGRHLTLIALNGVGCVKYLPQVTREFSLKNLLLAFDADDAGRKCTKDALVLLRGQVKIELIKDHERAGVKDLHALLMKTREENNVSRDYREDSGL